MGPADQDLGSSDRPDAQQVEEVGRQLPDQGEDFILEVFGLSLQGLDALGGGPKGPCRHPVLKALRRTVPELSTVGDLSRAPEFPQLGAEVIGRGHDQGLELVDRGSGSENRTLAGGEQDTQRLTLAAEPGLDQVLGGQGLLGGPDGIEHVGLASAPVGSPLGPADLDDMFAGLVKKGRESGTVAADAFQSPAAATGDMFTGEVQQAPVTAGVGRGVCAGQDSADGADGGSREGVAVGVDADDAVDLFCKHGHAVVLLRGRTTVVGVGLEWSHRVAEL